MLTTKELAARRKKRTRFSISKRSDRPRLSVHRSINHISVQLIDDSKSATIVSASSLDKELKGKLKSGGNIAAAKEVGTLIAARALKAGVTEVVFDRGAYRYHGRIKAVADGAREAGLKF
jgi:large subunit ribosomal protein L18